MHDALGVGGAQPGENPQAQPGGLVRSQRPVLLHDVAQRPVRNEFHDDPRAVVFFDYVVDADDVRVMEPGSHLGFPDRAAAGGLPFGIAE